VFIIALFVFKKQTNLHWFYLILAALLETAWTFSIKFLTFKDVLKLRFHNFYSPTEGLPILLPFLGYIVFGIGNIYFFSLAMKNIPITTAFTAWTALTIVALKVSEFLFFQEKISLIEMFFILLIVIGIIGLKMNKSV
jgi:quaternary ammonium compound-resistance protein SugE